MPRIIKDFSEDFIGIVYGYDANTREIEVFIPKLMPAIPENREDVVTKTNLAIVSAQYDVQHNTNITLTSTITAKAASYDNEMPKIGSRVFIDFLEDDPSYPTWSPWNYNGDYEIIDEEKYPEYFQFKIGDKQVALNKNDSIELQLPDGYEVMKLNDSADPKHKTFKITNEETVSGRIEKVEKIIGTSEFTRQYTDKFGDLQNETIPASGLYKLIQELQNEINFLKESIGQTLIVDKLPDASSVYRGKIVTVSTINGDAEYICKLTNGMYAWYRIDTVSTSSQLDIGRLDYMILE